MSGLCGAIDRTGRDPAAQSQAIQAMIERLHRSGRGGLAHWLDPVSGVALAHCGALRATDGQPLCSPCGRFVLALDGSLCNRRALRQALRLDPDGTECDAQLILQAVARWGLRRSLSRCRGAFALALWDAHQATLWLARDRAGQRAMYYGWNEGRFLFGSELKALFGHPRFHAEVDRDALSLLLRYGYVPAPHSILQGVFKLAPGHALKLDAAALAGGAGAHHPQQAACRYWCPRAEIETAKAGAEPAGDLVAATGQLDVLLRAAVAGAGPQRGRIATFLSGGTDSSVVAALAQSQSALPIDTFTLGFVDPGHDERGWAAQVAHRLGTRHTEHVMQASEALEHVHRLAQVWCEPFADPSQLPTLLASTLVARHVPVALTGDGGDELFHGHASYARAVRNARWARQLPGPLRRGLGRFNRIDPERARLGGFAAIAAEAAVVSGVEGHYLLRVSRWRDPARVVLGATEPATCFTDPAQWLRLGSEADRVRYLDFRMDLGEGVLTRVDRAGRAAGLDARAPLLDLEVIRFAWSLPDELKYAGGMHKRILKAVLRQHLPDALVDRPKRGFGPPLASWLAGPLRPWADDLLDAARLQREGHFEVGMVQRMWQAFCMGERKWHTHLWPILMFQAWHAGYRAELAARRPLPGSAG